MADTPEIIQSLDLNFTPAVKAAALFADAIQRVDNELANMKLNALKTAKDVNAAWSAEIGKMKATGLGQVSRDATQSRVILDQYGNTLLKIGNESEKSAQKQAKFNKELSELIHLRKTQQIDAQTFVQQASPFRTDTTTWESLQKQEQVKLVRELTSAEKEHYGVLSEKHKIEQASTAEVKQSALASLEAQAAAIQQKATSKGLSDEYRVQATLIRNQLVALQQRLAAEGKLSTEEVKQTAQLKEQLAILQSQTRAAISDTPTEQVNIFKQGWQRRAEWFLTGSLFFGVQNAARKAVETLSDVEMGVTEVARVMEDSSFQFNEYRDNLLGLGVDYGQVFDPVQDIALRWAQAGYNVEDSLEATKTSLLALNTAELNASQATESLVGIMAQWQLGISDLPLILDEINKTADDFTVTSQDLVDGLLRSSGAAKIMGLSIEQTISLLTVMREASGRTGREVGKIVAPCKSNLVRKHALNSGKAQRWVIVNQAA